MAAILFRPQCDDNAMYMPHEDIIKHYVINDIHGFVQERCNSSALVTSFLH